MANEENKKQKSKLREVIDFLLPILIAVAVALVLKYCVIANAVVPTGSMLNTIQEGDRVIASRLAYVKDDPQRYDIVIFKYPDDEKQYYVKRIVGLPGETVEVVNGVVYVTKTDGKTVQLCDQRDANRQLRALHRTGRQLLYDGRQPQPQRGLPLLAKQICQEE